MREDGKLDYLELPAPDLTAHKAFYAQAFGWRFKDYGPAYAAFSEGLDGGFTPDAMTPKPLPILYANDLEAMQAKVEAAGGAITHAIFAFPAGGASTSATHPATNWRSGPRARPSLNRHAPSLSSGSGRW